MTEELLVRLLKTNGLVILSLLILLMIMVHTEYAKVKMAIVVTAGVLFATFFMMALWRIWI